MIFVTFVVFVPERQAVVLTGLLYGVEPVDPITILASAGVLLLVAIVASWVPARTATAVDPMTALRAQ